MTTAARVKALYRALRRAEQRWPKHKEDERLYIRENIARLRQERWQPDSSHAQFLLDDAEKKTGVALHYGIAYAKEHYRIDERDRAERKLAALQPRERTVHD